MSPTVLPMPETSSPPPLLVPAQGVCEDRQVTPLDDLSPASTDLIFAALDHAVDNAGISGDGFIPFAFFDGSNGRSMTRFVSGDGGDLSECLAAGRESVRVVDSDVTCVALAWDGYLTYQGRRGEAVFVEGYEVGRDKGVLLAQRYTRVGGNLTVQGNPVLVGEPSPLVRDRRSRE